MARNPPWFLALGAVTGLLSAASTFLPLADLPAPRLFGYCFGIGGTAGRCEGVGAALYAFPGLVFGIAFAAAQMWRLGLDLGRAIILVLASGLANAVAVVLCVGFFELFTDLTEIRILDAPFALAGAIAGAAGGGLLSLAAARFVPGTGIARSTLAAALLGLLVPLVVELDIAGVFFFYIFWQAGYGTALASGLPPKA